MAGFTKSVVVTLEVLIVDQKYTPNEKNAVLHSVGAIADNDPLCSIKLDQRKSCGLIRRHLVRPVRQRHIRRCYGKGQSSFLDRRLLVDDSND